MDIARTQGEIAKANALKDPNAIQAAKEVLAGKGILNPTQEQINNQVGTTAMAPYGTGSDLQRALQAATALAQGLAGGNLQQSAAGAASPYVAGIIHDMTTNADGSVNLAANAMAHAVWGAVAAQANGNNELAGATGAAGGELMARYIAGEMYPGVRPEDLSEEQKQTLSALGTLAAGLAGGLTGDSSADAVAGAQAGQNAINNNLIGGSDEGQTPFVQEHGKDVLSCSDAPDAASCQRGKAVNNAIALALGAGAAGGAVIAITPEIIAVAQAGVSNCTTNPVLCFNEVSIWLADIGMGEALPAGLAVGATGKITAEQLAILSEIKAAMAVEKQTGKKVSADAVESIVSSKSTSGAENAANASKLNTQLSAQEIANGHAFEKHVLQRGEFDTLGIRTRAQFEQHVENVINNPTDVRYYNDGRVVYLDSTTRTVVIRNPGKGESTAFRPDYDNGWDKYIKLLPTQNTPPIR